MCKADRIQLKREFESFFFSAQAIITVIETFEVGYLYIDRVK